MRGTGRGRFKARPSSCPARRRRSGTWTPVTRPWSSLRKVKRPSVNGMSNSVSEIGSIASGWGRKGNVTVRWPPSRAIVAFGASGFAFSEVLPRVTVQDLRRERDDLRPGEVLRRRGGALGELAEPDVAVADGVVVVLERDRPAAALVLVGEPLEPGGRPERLLVVLHEDAVVEQGDPRRLEELARGVEPGAAEGDVVGLPLAGRPRGVEQGRVLAVDRPRLAVGVGVGPVGVEHLDLELAHQEDAAVAAVLAHAVGRARARPTRRGAGCRRTSPSSRSARPRAPSPCSRRPPSTSRARRRATSRRRGSTRRTGRPHPSAASTRSAPSAGSTTGGFGRRMSCCLQRAGGRPGADLLGGQAGEEPGGRDQAHARNGDSWKVRRHRRRPPRSVWRRVSPRRRL